MRRNRHRVRKWSPEKAGIRTIKWRSYATCLIRMKKSYLWNIGTWRVLFEGSKFWLNTCGQRRFLCKMMIAHDWNFIHIPYVYSWNLSYFIAQRRLAFKQVQLPYICLNTWINKRASHIFMSRACPMQDFSTFFEKKALSNHWRLPLLRFNL